MTSWLYSGSIERSSLFPYFSLPSSFFHDFFEDIKIVIRVEPFHFKSSFISSFSLRDSSKSYNTICRRFLLSFDVFIIFLDNDVMNMRWRGMFELPSSGFSFNRTRLLIRLMEDTRTTKLSCCEAEETLQLKLGLT